MLTATAVVWVPMGGFVIINVIAQPLIRIRTRRHYIAHHEQH